MRHNKAVAALVLAQAGLAETLIAPAQRAALYQAYNAAIHGKSRAEALEVMEDVAEGKPDDVIEGAGRRAGLQAYFTDQLPFTPPMVSLRIYALELIGRSALPEAIEYLSAMTPEKMGADDSQSLYPHSKLALRQALLIGVTDPQQQIAFLEAELTNPTNGYTALWAEEELCNRGSEGSTEMITQFIKRVYSGARGDDQAAFCQARMDIVNRDPDRAKALGTALRLDATRQDERTMRWAIGQLFAMQSAEAQAVLDAYATEVEKRFPDVPAITSVPDNQMHRALAYEIRRRNPRDRSGQP